MASNADRIQARIARDKAKKLQKKQEQATEYGDFDKVITQQNLLKSLNKRLRGTSWKGSVQAYVSHFIVKNNRAKKTVCAGKIPASFTVRSMVLSERGKRRNIQMVDIESRVIQGCFCDNSLLPILQPTLIYDNPASIKGKGVGKARERLACHLQREIRESGCEFWVLVFDFKSFFDSIRHALCLSVMRSELFDDRLRAFIMRIVIMYKESVLRFVPDKMQRARLAASLKNMEGVGITLGSQISQVMALVTLNALDHALKEVCRLHRYIRYMDDGFIAHRSKETLWRAAEMIKEISARLGLNLNMKKTRIVKATRGFTFLKIRYVVTQTGHVIKKIAKSSVVRMRRKLKKFRHLVDAGKMTLDDVFAAFKSWLGYMKCAKTRRARKHMIARYRALFGNYRLEGVPI